MASGSLSDAAFRLLLVDPDATSADRTRQALVPAIASETRLTLAEGSRQAIEALRRDRFDLVLIDLEALSGHAGALEETVGKLARHAGDALVIALSDGVSISGSVAAMRAGAHDFVAKPVDGLALATRIARLAGRLGRARVLALGLVPEGDAASEGRPAESVLMPQRSPILPMWQQEQRIIEDAVERFNGNIALAAAALEISPSTIYRKRQSWAEMSGERGAA